MGLRQSPKLTPARLAALRRNAQKCTGPKTSQGKARSSLNALKHGRFAQDLPAKLRAAGVREVEGVFKFHSRISRLYQGNAGRILVDRSANTLAAAIWRKNKLKPSARVQPLAKTKDPGARETELPLLWREQLDKIKVISPEQLEEIKLRFSQSSKKKEGEGS